MGHAHDVPDPTATLRDYTRAKLEVAALVRDAWRLARTRSGAATDDQPSHSEWQALLAQLAEDRFNLAVVGQFKRGKSTLINAILGRELLPTGLLPLTSAITSLCYGPAERVRLRRAGWTLEEEVPLAQLADYITEHGNPGNEKGLIEARVELPVPFLRRGLYFIDTPGIGSARQENTATTYGFLPRMDAVIFVTSAEAPLSEAEARFLADIRTYVRQRQMFVIVNKMDLLSGLEAEREEVLGYIRAQAARALEVEADALSLYVLSARDGLRAKLQHDPSGIAASGMLAFEQALAVFLAADQGRAFLVSMLDRALRLFAEIDAPLDAVNVASVEPPDGDSGAAPQTLVERLDAATLRQSMLALRARLLDRAAPLTTDVADRPPFASAELAVMDEAVTAAAGVADTALTAPNQHAGASGRPRRSAACPICAAQAEALFVFFAQWQQALATGAEAQRAFAAVGGFCPAHTWQFQGMASPLGISEGYAPLIESLAAGLSEALTRSLKEAVAVVSTLGATSATCPACRVLRETEREQADRLLQRLAVAAEREKFAQSPVELCLPHLRAALARLAASTEDQSVAEFLLREQIRGLDELSEDLRSYALKRDALRRGFTNHNEETAWRRALVQVASERAVGGGATASSEPT
jgi:GTP-binding protein EngB required for normal cell division